uniref:Uncharacterized protein n=1 Tax=Rhizophora mucronata TaxID=61149 RepID=A0A2P2IHC6_RHIMU
MQLSKIFRILFKIVFLLFKLS